MNDFSRDSHLHSIVGILQASLMNHERLFA
jgi:hypothetical protein